MKIRYNHHPISLRIAAVLLCLTLLSFHMMSGLFARFVSEGRTDEAARVAAFEINVSAVYDNIVAKMGESDSGIYSISVTNDSEVAVSYDIVLTLNEALPTGTSVTIDGHAPAVSNEEKTLRFSNVGALNVSETQTKEMIFCTLQDFTADTSADSKTNVRTFTVSVVVTQID